MRDPKCELELQGEDFGSAQYSVAMSRASGSEGDRFPMHPEVLVEAMSHQLLLLHETGVIEHLDNRWILGTNSLPMEFESHHPFDPTGGGHGADKVKASGPGTTGAPTAGTKDESGRKAEQKQKRHENCVPEDHSSSKSSSSTLEFENIASVLCV